VFLCSSAGELDVVLPLLRIEEIEEFSLVSFRQELSARLKDDGFYDQIAGDKFEDRSIRRLPEGKVSRWRKFVLNSVATFLKYRHFDFFCFEYGHAGREKNILIILLTIFGCGRRIVYYPHGHAVTPDSAYDRQRWPLATKVSSRFGSRIIKLDGVDTEAGCVTARYPILHPSWRSFLDGNVRPIYDNHVVILSRAAHPSYLLAANRMRMFDDVFALFAEHYPGSRIVIKAHPREDLAAAEFSNRGPVVDVTYENTYSVLRNAHIVVSFWTSAFFQCIALGVPVVEYHIAHEEFRRLYPAGSLNQPFLPSFSDPAELGAYFISMKASQGRGGR